MIRAVTLLAVMVVAAPAIAAPKIALPAIEGDDTGAMRDAVAAALDGDQLTILGERETNRAVDGLRNENLAEMTEKQAKKLSSDLEADAVVTAVLGKKGKAKTLKFRLFVGGKKQQGFTVQFKNAKSPKFKTKLRDKLVDRISGNEEKAAPPQDDEPLAVVKKKKVTEAVDDTEDPNPKPKKTEPPEGEDETDAPKKPKKKKSAARDVEEGDDDETAVVKRSEGPAHSANRAAARVGVGASFAQRSLIFTQRGAFPEGPKPFKNSPVPGARVDGELYPIAFMNPDSIAAGLGIAFDFDRTLSLKLRTTAEPNKDIKVTQQAFTVGGRFRFVFGKRETSPSVTVGVDYGKRTWKADRSGLMDRMSLNGLGSLDLPDTDYAFIAPGLGFRIPFGGHVAFGAYGKPLFVSQAGQIQKSTMYGKAKIFGIQASGGLDIIFGKLAVRLSGEFTQFGYTFLNGGGMLANSRDGDPTSPDIGGAQDRSIGGAVTVGFLY